MGRGKTQMKRIENDASRQVTFSKRRNGLLKKAFELSVLCESEVAVIIFSPRGKLHEFASSSMQKTIERYRMHIKHVQPNHTSMEHDVQKLQHLKHETESMAKKIELLEASKRKFLGEGIGSCTLEEIQQVEKQVEQSITCVRNRKMQVFEEQIEKLKDREKVLASENVILSAKVQYGIQPIQSPEGEKDTMQYNASSTVSADVETELFIGLPVQRIHCSRKEQCN